MAKDITRNYMKYFMRRKANVSFHFVLAKLCTRNQNRKKTCKMHTSTKVFFVTVHILLLPLNIIILLLFAIYKLFVDLVAKIFQNFVGSIPGASKVFLGDLIWDRPHSSIIVCVELESETGSVELEKVSKDFEKAYDLRDGEERRCYRELGYHPVNYLGFGFWQEVENFQISDQIEYLCDDLKEKPLPQIVENLLRQPYEKGRPLWNIYLLNGRLSASGKKSLLFLRFHHLLADGMSIVKLCYTMFGSTKLPDNFTKPKASMQRWDKMAGSIFAKLSAFLNMLTVGYIDYVNDLLLTYDKNRMNFDENGNANHVGEWLCSVGKKVDVADLKLASRGLNCSIIHIVFTAFSRGIEKYFRKYHETKTDPPPENVHLVFPVPLPKHPNLRLVNHWALSRMELKFLLSDVTETINFLKSEIARASASVLPLISAFMFRYTAAILPTPVVDRMSKAKGTCTMLFSNVVGPQEEVTFAGSYLTGMMFWMPIVQEASALSGGVISCNGGLRVCLVGDVGCVPDRAHLEDLSEMIYAELNDLCRVGKKL